MTVFEKSNWIWLSVGESPDQYAEFCDIFVYNGEKTVMCLSCDSDYTLYVNGAFAASNQYGDFEYYKIYDELDITEFLKPGENKIKILVHHCGVATQRYLPAKAGLIYEVVSGDLLLSYSREGIPSRLSPAYASGRQKLITGQLGFSFFYDATRETEEGYTPAVCVEKNCTFYPRPIKKAKLLDRRPMKMLTRIDDTHWLIDLGGETVGVPTLDIVSETEQTLTVAYGEHIEDGCVRYIIGTRNFSYTYKTAKGRNIFTNYMLRLGCRYLEVFAEQPIEVNYVGVLPQVYETETRVCKIENELDRSIYGICLNTLKLCMMEHYVDCPWREQDLYMFDSRNQMLCGYYAFENGNAEYARSNLKLITEERREDGMLSMCFPSGVPLIIPSFALWYPVTLREYLEHTGDDTLILEALPKIGRLCECFLENEKDGLIQTFAGEDMWNFYDWSEYSQAKLRLSVTPTPDLVINALFVLALDSYEKMCRAVGAEFPYAGKADAMRDRIRETFLTESGVFTMHQGKQEYTVLGNSLAILAKVTTETEAAELCPKLISGELVDCSLSMQILKYQALLDTDTEAYGELILNEIRTGYKKILDAGSDTVWETLDGASAFKNAGSLCHGWSAVPIYIYHRLGIAK